MLYKGNAEWVEEIDLINTNERVLGGISGPTNRPHRELADRTQWLYKNIRIPIFEDLTLNVSASGNDETGNLKNPFRQPQAAINWAVANLDFKSPKLLTISLGAGTFEGINIVGVTAMGVSQIAVVGTGTATTFVRHIFAFYSAPVNIDKLTVNGTPSRQAQIIAVGTSMHIAVVRVVPVAGFGCFYVSNGIIHAYQSGVITIDAGTCASVFSLSDNGTLALTEINIVLNGVTGNTFVLASTASRAVFNEITFSGSGLTASRFHIVSGASLWSSGGSNTLPGTTAGYSDAGTVVY